MNLLGGLPSLGLNFFKVKDAEGEVGLSIYLLSDLISSNFNVFVGFHGRSVSFFTIPKIYCQVLLSSNLGQFVSYVFYHSKINPVVFMFTKIQKLLVWFIVMQRTLAYMLMLVRISRTSLEID